MADSTAHEDLRAVLPRLRRLDTSTIATALARLGVRGPHEGFSSAGLRCLIPGREAVVGFAVTCREDTTTPKTAATRPFDDVYRALDAGPKPAIVVCQDVGDSVERSCHLGEIMATTMHRLGAVGFITDGGVRDVDGIAKHAPDFAVYAMGTVPGAGQPSLIDVGELVDIGGLTVTAGDLLHADADGVACIPVESLDAVLDEAGRIVASEHERLTRLEGEPVTLAAALGRSA